MNRFINRARAARRDDAGFTLIELLIVIIILGVLAAIVVFSVRGIQNDSKLSACKTEVRTVNTAIEAFYAKNQNYPADLAALVSGGFLHEEPSEYVNGVTAATATTPATAAKKASAPAGC